MGARRSDVAAACCDGVVPALPCCGTGVGEVRAHASGGNVGERAARRLKDRRSIDPCLRAESRICVDWRIGGESRARGSASYRHPGETSGEA